MKNINLYTVEELQNLLDILNKIKWTIKTSGL